MPSWSLSKTVSDQLVELWRTPASQRRSPTIFTKISKPSIAIVAQRRKVPIEKCHTIMLM
jgi:hypothetical protein